MFLTIFFFLFYVGGLSGQIDALVFTTIPRLLFCLKSKLFLLLVYCFRSFLVNCIWVRLMMLLNLGSGFAFL